MNEPVMDPEGNTYEKCAIEEWIRLHGTSPLSRKQLTVEQLTPNRALINLLEGLEIATEDKGDEATFSPHPFQVFCKGLDVTVTLLSLQRRQ